MVQFECSRPRHLNPCVSLRLGELACWSCSLLPFSLCSNKKLVYYGRHCKKVKTLLNNPNRLQMVQFECPRVRNPFVSFSFREFPFQPLLPPLSAVIRNGFIIFSKYGKKVEQFQLKLA